MPNRLKIVIREDVLEIEGDFTKDEILNLKTEWFKAIEADRVEVHQAIQALTAERERLKAAVDAQQ